MTRRTPPPSSPSKSDRSVTPMALVQAIVRAYQERALDPSGALAAAQIEPSLVTDTAQRISALQMERLSGHAMQELDDESLGWSRRRLPWGSYGMLIRSCLSAPTLGVALKRWCRHHGLICDNVVLMLQLEHGRAAIVLRERQRRRVARQGGTRDWFGDRQRDQHVVQRHRVFDELAVIRAAPVEGEVHQMHQPARRMLRRRRLPGDRHFAAERRRRSAAG